MTRADREDYADQERALTAARAQLADALDTLARTAHNTRKAARARYGRPDLDAVYADARAVKAAHEACDIAAYDLQTARGEDG